MLLARAFARAELDPGRPLQGARVSRMEAASRLRRTASSGEEISDHFSELAAALDNDPFAIYAELASTAAAFPAEHHAAVAGALTGSDNEAVREAALGFAFSPDPAVSSAALVAIAQQGRTGLVSNRLVDRLVRMRPWLSERRRAKLDNAVRVLRPKTALPVPLARWEIRSALASLCDGDPVPPCAVLLAAPRQHAHPARRQRLLLAAPALLVRAARPRLHPTDP